MRIIVTKIMTTRLVRRPISPAHPIGTSSVLLKYTITRPDNKIYKLRRPAFIQPAMTDPCTQTCMHKDLGSSLSNQSNNLSRLRKYVSVCVCLLSLV